MGRSNQQLVRLLQLLLRGVQSGKIKLRWLVVVAVLAAGYLLLQPVLKRSTGIELPGFGDLVADTAKSGTAGTDPRPAASGSPTGRGARYASTDKELAAILNGDSRRVYTSAAGLRYTRGSIQGHRLKHLMAHTHDEPDRPGPHGVFDVDDPGQVVSLVDEAYLKAQQQRDTRVQPEGERTVYEVNLRRRIGYVGGKTGNRRNRPAADHLRLVVEGDRLITAFPITP